MINLFNYESVPILTIREIVKETGVSSATVRNWIKTNYIQEVAKGKILKSSFEDFKNNILGKEKLTKRANKSLKDSFDKEQNDKEFLDKIKNEDIHNLGNLYEESLSNSYRNKEGIYYTPKYIVEDLFFIEKVIDKTFCDPCCGSGNFIIRAIELGFKPENVFGFDKDPIAVEITKKRIFEKTGFCTENIICADFIDEVIKKGDIVKKYDFVYTNPPWGGKIEKSKKNVITSYFKINSNNDLSSIFLYAILKTTNENAKIGLLLPDAFFNIGNYSQARNTLLDYKIERLKDYSKPFKKLQTGAVGIEFSKKHKENYKIKCEFGEEKYTRKLSSFAKNPKQIFNISANENEEKVIEKIFSVKYETLYDNAIWGLGIVTGNNEKYLKTEGEIPIYKGSDITKNGLKSPSNFIDDDFSSFQQVAPLELYKANKKIMYKFISSNLCFYCDNEQRYILNSANFLIINKNFSVSMEVVSDLLNSDFMNWLFRKIFNTHKILRGDLEMLPIHTQFLKNGFSEKEYLDNLGIEKIKNGTYRIKK